MSNMSYCRFENTLKDLRDCARTMSDFSFKPSELSEEERRAMYQLIDLCSEISAEQGDDESDDESDDGE